MKIIVYKSLKILFEIELGKFKKLIKNLIKNFIIKVNCHKKLMKTSILSKYEIYIIGKTFTLSRKLYYVYDTFTRTLKIIVDKSLKILVEIDIHPSLSMHFSNRTGV